MEWAGPRQVGGSRRTGTAMHWDNCKNAIVSVEPLIVNLIL
jgi:hypothetical protein